MNWKAMEELNAVIVKPKNKKPKQAHGNFAKTILNAMHYTRTGAKMP